MNSVNEHGDKISIDTSVEPPVRTLALKGSEYALETDDSTGILHKPGLEYSQKLDQLNTQLRTINVLQTNLVRDHIEDLVEHGFVLQEIKNQFKRVY